MYMCVYLPIRVFAYLCVCLYLGVYLGVRKNARVCARACKSVTASIRVRRRQIFISLIAPRLKRVYHVSVERNGCPTRNATDGQIVSAKCKYFISQFPREFFFSKIALGNYQNKIYYLA